MHSIPEPDLYTISTPEEKHINKPYFKRFNDVNNRSNVTTKGVNGNTIDEILPTL